MGLATNFQKAIRERKRVMIVKFTLHASWCAVHMVHNPLSYWKVEDWFRDKSPTREAATRKLHHWVDANCFEHETDKDTGKRVKKLDPDTGSALICSGTFSIPKDVKETLEEHVEYYRNKIPSVKRVNSRSGHEETLHGMTAVHFGDLAAALKGENLLKPEDLEDPADAEAMAKIRAEAAALAAKEKNPEKAAGAVHAMDAGTRARASKAGGKKIVAIGGAAAAKLAPPSGAEASS